ncbi:hypothetical protein [Rhodococcus koreensis]|uniref:HD domain-containing protein n=1 Tax=Rhodococcus koreensis TaxID=99653 RepID=A0A1H5BN98_9NOCA|nr:hypothetical protein [Rhodococcus koreensis]SED56022.1 hypothetical protein SAMN04490239_8779 [Rhodococcus koreensis]
MADTVAGIDIPDTALVAEATELVREAANPLIYHHSRRVFLVGSLRARHQKLTFDPEPLYVGAMFHDLGLTTKYRRTDQRFEVDGADEERGAVVASHPRPNFKNEILAAFTNGLEDRPDTTFGNVKADVLAHFVPGFVPGDFVGVIVNSAWSE